MSVVKIRNKITEKEAIKYLGDKNKFECAEFFKGHGKFEVKFSDYGLLIHTLEGDMRVSEGDWIIKGLRGEFYPCKPDIFEKSYEIIS